MGTIGLDSIKELREMTSCGVIECKKALEESNGDLSKAKLVLQKRGRELAIKKGSRDAKEGRIEAYVHAGSKIAVLLELNCETDFVASNENFIALAKDVCMHIVAVNPRYLSKEDIPENILNDESDKEGFVKQNCLLNQAFVKDPKKSVTDCVNALITSMGENISIGRFTRYKVNEIV